ncbi:ATP-binding protein [Nisaea acidiphila]|uniref:histidine kinase n=1 Tax=Nisaea acidiphila TaxID=1862145 RepID=A0A9J7ASQ7_9PROT|nr:ATP-binding protein [Nisaea acidiphila]UUX50707.1 ATP-binding protein [Nisaea acidiphila]
MTRGGYLSFGLAFGALLIIVGLYFIREIERIPIRVSESDQTMLRADAIRHAFKVSLLSSRSYEAYLTYLKTGREEDRQQGISLGKAAIGFAASALSNDHPVADQVVPLIRANLAILEKSSSPDAAAASLPVFAANMRSINRETGEIEQGIWQSFQKDFVEFQTSEQRALIAYQLAAALAIGTLLVVVFFFLRQRALLRLIETREEDLEEMIELRNDELDLLRETQAAAQAADRAKTEFLALMSHELRTPLNAIVGFSEIVKSGDQNWVTSEKTIEYAAAIHSAGLHLLNVINDILDLTKIEAGETEINETRLDVSRSLQRASGLLLQRAVQKGLTVQSETDEDLPDLIADERLVFQILINLLSNAIKFTGEGGEIILFAARSKDGGLDLGVRDSGVGIAEEDIPKVMQPFAQLRRNSSVTHEGTGLGLPLSRRFAELHGASVSIESEEDVGTTVTVHFPESRVTSEAVEAPVPQIESAGA